MKVELYYDEGYQFLIKPETETDKCAVEYLASRPMKQVTILITRLGIFRREEK